MYCFVNNSDLPDFMSGYHNSGQVLYFDFLSLLENSADE